MNPSTSVAPGEWARTIKPQNIGIANFLAFALLPLSGFATDIYLPSLPGMAADLQVSAVQVQFTITLFLVSYGISQLFIGSFLDSYGRYSSGLVSLLVFTISSILIAVADSIWMIYAMRVIQGVTVGIAVAGKRAFFVDLYAGSKLKNYLGMFSIIWSTGPIIAPFVGGYLQSLYGWRANFWFLAVLGAALGIAEFFFSGETLPKRNSFQLKKVLGVYREILSHLPFVLGVTLLGLSYAMVMVCNLTAPFIIEHHLQFDAVTTGYCSLILGIAWMVGGFISKAVVHHGFFRKLFINIGLQAILIIAMMVAFRYVDNIYALVAFAFGVHVGAGFTFNNYMTFSMTRFPQNAGVASGLTGGFNFLLVSAFSYGIISVLPAQDGNHLAMSYGILSILVILVVALARRQTPVVH